MNQSVKAFYQKDNNDPEYYKKYDREHSPRLDFIVKHFKLDEIKNKVVADFGCGYGFFLKRLDDSNKKYGFDGAQIKTENFLCEFQYVQTNLDEDWKNSKLFYKRNWQPFENMFDVSFCFETLEHLASPYNCLINMKRM